MIRKLKYGHVAFYYDAADPIRGVTELPANFVGVANDRVLIVGKPSKDVIQTAIASVGFRRAHLQIEPEWAAGKGLLVNLVA